MEKNKKKPYPHPGKTTGLQQWRDGLKTPRGMKAVAYIKTRIKLSTVISSMTTKQLLQWAESYFEPGIVSPK